jgi:hypothetical protein
MSAAIPLPHEVGWTYYAGPIYHYKKIDPARLLSSGLLSAEAMPGDRVRCTMWSEREMVHVRRCAGGMVNASIPAALAIQRDAQFNRFRAGLMADAGLSLVKGEAAEAPSPAPSTDGWMAGTSLDGASFSISVPNGVLTLTFSGPITAAFIAMAHSPREMSQQAVVADFTKADCRFTGDELDAAMLAHLMANSRSPRALLVTPKQLDLFQGHAVRFAVRAIPQRTFYNRAAAEAWALATQDRLY